MKRNLYKIVLLLSLVLALLINYTNQPLSAQSLSAQSQYVMDNAVVEANTINPNLHHATDKKIILTSQSLQWSFVRDNIRLMESKHPYFDGIATWLRKPILSGEFWTEDDVQLSTVSQINWGRYTENFVILGFSGREDFEFFNNNKWSAITHNAGMVSKMVKAGRLKGVFVDDENYSAGSHGWKYDPSWYPLYTFEQVKAKCRERGKAFMQALQSNVSDPLVILDFIWFGDHWNRYDKNNGRQILWLAFKDGMLEAARAGDVLVEGNELAYYYQETKMFTDIYNEFRQQKFPKYGASDLQDKYKTQVQIGHGIYPTVMYGWCSIENHSSFTKKLDWPVFTDEENDAWWKHQVYHSLLTSDKYVWIWSERWDWWGDEKLPLAPNLASIIEEVKSKINSQQSLNYDLVKYGPNWGSLDPPSEKWHFATAPTITITNPVNKSNTKSDFTINTSVSENVRYDWSDPNDIKYKVEFYINSMRVGVVYSLPYSFKVSGLAKGTYTIFARVFDQYYEQHTTSAPIIIHVK